MGTRRNRTAIWIWAGLAFFLVVAFTARGLISRGRPLAAEGTAVNAPETAMGLSPPIPAEPFETSTSAASGRSPAMAASRPRSPLERSPGYYPPDDPESMSVVTGRREAKPVDLDLTGGATSDMDLARMLLAGLNARDPRALHALRVTRKEFEVIFWPEFPESRPVTNITADDAWGMSETQSSTGANRAIDGYGGRQLELLRVETDPPAPYTNFMMYRGVRIVVRDAGTGETERLRFAPTIVERRGRYKALLFKD